MAAIARGACNPSSTRGAVAQYARTCRRSRVGARPVFYDPNQVEITLGPLPDPVESVVLDGRVLESIRTHGTPDKRFRDPRPPYAVSVKGPLGQLSFKLKPYVSLQFTSRAKMEQQKAGDAGLANLEPFDFTKYFSGKATETISSTDVQNLSCILVNVDFPHVDRQRAFWGTSRSLLANSIIGVSEGYRLRVRIEGVGWRVSHLKPDEPSPPTDRQKRLPPMVRQYFLAQEAKCHRLVFKLGRLADDIVEVPEGVRVEVVSPTLFYVSGIDKEAVSSFAAKCREFRKPEPYNLKGIFVGEETIEKKEGKKK